jgi:hypothetical protein
MKSHGSLGTERTAVRRSANAGKGFRETHGLLGNLRKLLYAPVKWSHDALPTGTQRISEKICASVRFPANLCPARVFGARHDVRWSALPCDVSRRATVRAGHHHPTGNCKTAHRRPPWATSACSSLRPIRSQSQNQLKPLRKVNYGPQCRQCTRERKP